MGQQIVLLVEDNPRNVRLIRRAFSRSNFPYELHVVGDGAEALAYLRRQGDYTDPHTAPRPDLILLDLNLPGMSGHEVLQACKHDDHVRQIPIVVLTTSEHPEDVQRAYDAGANAYLAKPVEFSRFLVILEHLNTFWLDIVQLPPKRAP